MKKPNAAPGGASRDAMRLVGGHTVRGDGAGKPLASPYGCYSHTDDVSRRNAAAQPHFRPNKDLAEDTQRALGGYMAGGAVVDRADGGQTGTSIFDPVLCELAYRWFTCPGWSVLDPFAGGSVRGIVATKLGRAYTGVDLSAVQIAANVEQAQEITPDSLPRWIVGDSRNIKTLSGGEYDFIFSCPPYADLEVYSDDPQDLSTLDYTEFIAAYRGIVADCVSMLKENRFACFVVGDVRDDKGFYRNFPAHTIDAFQAAGMTLYNEAILVTAVGSLPIRVGKQFGSYRKLGKTHQNVLVFYKGNPKAIKELGEVEFGELTE